MVYADDKGLKHKLYRSNLAPLCQIILDVLGAISSKF